MGPCMANDASSDLGGRPPSCTPAAVGFEGVCLNYAAAINGCTRCRNSQVICICAFHYATQVVWPENRNQVPARRCRKACMHFAVAMVVACSGRLCAHIESSKGKQLCLHKLLAQTSSMNPPSHGYWLPLPQTGGGCPIFQASAMKFFLRALDSLMLSAVLWIW